MFSTRTDSTAVFPRQSLDFRPSNTIATRDRAIVARPAKNGTLLSVAGLNISTAEGTPLVTDVAFNLQTGGTLGIVGESGSGKSLTCRAILGILPTGLTLSGGTIGLAGEDLTRLPSRAYRDIRRERFGAVFQDPGSYLNPSMRIGEQIAESVRVHKGCSRRDAREQALVLLQDVGMKMPTVVARQFPHELSGGMLQRALIAIALSGDPQLLIADEVTTALDVIVQHQVVQLLKQHQARRGLAMVIVSHDLALVSQVCDDLVVMQNGVIVEQGSRDEVLNRPRHAYTQALIANHLKYGLENYD